MLLHNLVPSSVEAALPFASNHGKDWVPVNSWNDCFEGCEYFEDGSNILITDSNEIPESNGKPKRRKLQENSFTSSPAEQETEGTIGMVRSFPVEVNNDYVTEAGVSGAITKVGKRKEEVGKKSLDKENIFSALNVERGGGSTTSRIKPCSIGERSNSELSVLGEDMSTRDLYISMPMITCALNKINFDSCELCGELDNTLNMLLCDHCEKAFHVSCCDSKTKIFPTDEWFCESCSQLDGKVSLEAYFIKSKNITWLNGNSMFKSAPVSLMLKCPEAYVSRVRIGDAFQATVPEWSDEVQNRDLDSIGEPLELDLAAAIGLHGCSSNKFSMNNSTSNWLQCQEVLYDHTGECAKGICGKWRRAPLSEIRTIDWDCSCSVLWDPFHADCAVPQELENDEVQMQLKYIEQLRSGSAPSRKTNSVA